MAITLLLKDWHGPYLDLCGHSPTNVMGIEDFVARGADGRGLRWTETEETVRVSGVPIQLAKYRIQGPIPSRLYVSYRVSPGREEGDAHIGFTGRCFGYLGRNFAIITGREVFLLPAKAESVRRIEVTFSLPPGWTPEAPWRRHQAGWMVEASRGSAAEHLAASTIGLGHFRERSFLAGRTRVRLATFEAVKSGELTTSAEDAVVRCVTYLRSVFGRDLGPEYLVLLAPETPEGRDIVGGGWATGQGRTLLPISTERLRQFAEEFIEAYVRYAPYRTETRHPEEFWLVDAIVGFYARRAVARAGLGDDEAVARGLATGYLTAVSTQGVSRDLEGPTTGSSGDRATWRSIGPLMLQELDHELRSRYSVAAGLDAIMPRFLSGGLAPSFWSLLPRRTPHEWDAFREDYVRGKTFAPVPDLFALVPTKNVPSPAGGEPSSHVTIVYTGNTDGYLENCGCKTNQSGGIARRATIVDSIRSVDPEAILLDAGSAIHRPDQYENPNVLARKEQRFYLEMLDRMGYAASTVGIGEIAQGADAFREQTRGLRLPFLSANVFDAGTVLGPRSVLLRPHGHRLLVIGVFDPPRGGKSQLRLDKELTRLSIRDVTESVREEIRDARPPPDLIVVMGKISPTTVRLLANALPELDIVISTDGNVPQWGRNSTARHQVILEEDQQGFLGRTLVLYTQIGMYGLSVADLDLDGAGRIAGAKLAESWLTDAVRDQNGIRRAMNRFYDRVGALAEAQAGVRAPLSGDPYWQGKRFAGAEGCRGCHQEEFAQWKGTPHASAYKTLLDKHRHYQPVCVSCHVVGFGSEYGYHVGQPENPLGNVQCEVCHGPGAEHAQHPSGANIRRQVSESVCLECHNPEHSDRFVYEERLPMVVHRHIDRVSHR